MNIKKNPNKESDYQEVHTMRRKFSVLVLDALKQVHLYTNKYTMHVYKYMYVSAHPIQSRLPSELIQYICPAEVKRLSKISRILLKHLCEEMA